MNDTMTRRMGALLAATGAVVAFGIGGSAHAASDKGANIDGSYSSDGQFGGPSANGNGNGQGNGKAVGRPAMGTVGKADDKNPPGQNPYGTAGEDGNNGYECDGSSGVGAGNPAHSNCDMYGSGGGAVS